MEASIQSKSRRTIFFLLTVLCIFVLAGSFAWWTMKKGIEVDRLSIAGNDITRLFLQIDRGLIIHIDRLAITASNAPARDTDLEGIIALIKKWGRLIQEIDINRLSYRNHTLAVLYRDRNFRIRGDVFILEAQPAYDGGTFFIDIKRLEIKPFKTILAGKASYSRLKNRFHFSGMFTSSWGKGEMVLEEVGDQVAVHIQTDKFTDLTGLLQQFPLDEDVVRWISENISAQTYQINELNLQFSLSNPLQIGPENIRGSATADSVTVQFNPDLPPVHSDVIRITFQDDRLFFALDKPVYDGKSLEGSTVYIDNIIQPDSVLAINIMTQSRLDSVVLHLLEAYDISLPFRQLTGDTMAEINLLFDLPEFKLKTTGTFVTNSGSWSWADIPFQTDGASVRLKDNNIEIREAEISYGDILRTRLKGQIDTSMRRAGLVSEIERLNLIARTATVLKAEQMRLPLEIDYGGDAILIKLEEINTFVTLTGEAKTIDINNLASVEPLVPLLRNIKFTQGNFHLALNDFSHLEFRGELEIPGSILSSGGEPVTRFAFSGIRKPEQTEISVNNDRILINISDQVKINLKDYLATIDFDRMSKEEKKPLLPLPLMVTGPHTLLQVKDLQVPTRDFIFKAAGEETVLNAELEKGSFRFKKNGETVHFTGKGLDARLAEKFIHFTDLSEGLVNISVDGDSEGYNGYLEFSNVVIREYLLMNNILAFLNSIPALATLSEPGFDHDGYRVREGIVLYDLQDKLLIIRQLRTEGTTVNCEAQGWIDFANRTLRLNMELITLKDYSKIINMLPWAGYAFLGEDGSLSTSLKIDGSLDDPTITTYLTEDIIMTPVNVIRRTIEWPFRIFSGQPDAMSEPSEQVTPAPMVPE